MTNATKTKTDPRFPGVTITVCPPALAKGAETSALVKRHIAKERREFKKAAQNEK